MRQSLNPGFLAVRYAYISHDNQHARLLEVDTLSYANYYYYLSDLSVSMFIIYYAIDNNCGVNQLFRVRSAFHSSCTNMFASAHTIFSELEDIESPFFDRLRQNIFAVYLLTGRFVN